MRQNRGKSAIVYQALSRRYKCSIILFEIHKVVQVFFFLVCNPRYEMRNFVTCVFDNLVEECYAAILHDRMVTYRFKEHDQKVEDIRLKKKISM